MAEKAGPADIHQPISNPPQPGPYPPPQPPQYPQPMMGPVIVAPVAVGTQPTLLTCNYCGVMCVTRMVFKPSLRTHMIALLLCIFGCWPCIWIPYCMESCNNLDHYCSNCGAYVGSYIN